MPACDEKRCQLVAPHPRQRSTALCARACSSYLLSAVWAPSLLRHSLGQYSRHAAGAFIDGGEVVGLGAGSTMLPPLSAEADAIKSLALNATCSAQSCSLGGTMLVGQRWRVACDRWRLPLPASACDQTAFVTPLVNPRSAPYQRPGQLPGQQCNNHSRSAFRMCSLSEGARIHEVLAFGMCLLLEKVPLQSQLLW